MGKQDSKAWAAAHLAKIKAEMGSHFNAEVVLVDVLAAFDELMQVVEPVAKPFPQMPPSAVALDSPKSYARHKLENLPEPPVPQPLTDAQRENMQTLLLAASHGDLALVSAIRKSDNANVGLVCAMNFDRETEETIPMPLAVMIEGNPFEMFYDPTEG